MLQNRLSCCEANLHINGTVRDIFLDNIITQDETPLSLYIPQSKRVSGMEISNVVCFLGL